MSTSIPVSVSNSGATKRVQGVAGQRIRVLGLCLVAAGAVSVKLQAVGGSTRELTGAMPLIAGVPLVMPIPAQSDAYLAALETEMSESVFVHLSGAVAVAGWLVVDYRPGPPQQPVPLEG